MTESSGADRSPDFPFRTSRFRSGHVGIVGLLATVILLVIAGVTLTVAVAGYQGHQLRGACEAASLAAAGELFAEHLAEDDSRRRRMFPRSLAHTAVNARRVDWARKAALAYVGENYEGREPLSVDGNRSNHPRGDIVVGHVRREDGVVTLIPWERGRADSVLVRATTKTPVASTVYRWLSQSSSIRGILPESSAIAVVRRRVHGFRPAGPVPVPMVPLILPGECFPELLSQRAEGKRANDKGKKRDKSPPGGKGDPSDKRAKFRTDRFTVDPRTGEVSAGGDGRVERSVVLFVHDSQKPVTAGEAALARFSSGALREERLARQIRRGLTETDLEALGGRLVLPEQGPLLLPIVPLHRTRDAERIGHMLKEIIGQARVWPVSVAHPEQDDDDAEKLQGARRVVGFVGARVVDCRWVGQRQLEIVLQAGRLLTPTALLSERHPESPWIGKLSLVR